MSVALFSLVVLIFVSHFTETSSSNRCPSLKQMKPCQCFAVNGTETLSVNVSCSFATSWNQIKTVLDSFRNKIFIDTLVIEQVQDFSTRNRSLHRLFRNLMIKNLIIDDCIVSTKIPKNIFANSTVQSLQMENLNLRKIPIRALRNLPMLLELSLANNAITSIPRKAFRYQNKNLKLLNLQGNNLTSVPTKSLNALPYLEILILSNNQIDQVLPNSFAVQRNLLALELTDNKISSLNQDAFLGLTKLQHLGLSGNPLKVSRKGES